MSAPVKSKWADPSSQGKWSNNEQILNPPPNNQQMVPAAAGKGKWGAAAGQQGGEIQPAPAQQTDINIVKAANSVLAPSVLQTVKERGVGVLSNNATQEAGKGDGALSVKTHNQQMVVVEEGLKNMTVTLYRNIGTISNAMEKFAKNVEEANTQIVKYCKAIIERAVANDPKLEPDDVVKANMIVKFTGDSVLIMKVSSEASLDILSKGMGIIRQQTAEALDTIFTARTNQVKLFAAKLEVFHKQEKHELEQILQVQEFNMKEQQQFFNQLKDIVHLDMEAKDQAHKQQLDVKKANLEEEIAVRGQLMKEEESRNKMQIEQAQHRLEVKKAQWSNALEHKKVDLVNILETKKEKNRHGEAEHKIKEDAVTARHASNNATSAAMHQANIQGQVAHHQADADIIKTAIGVAKPPCVVM